ncbi:hypothetical protein WBG78_16100 [Chryseolinea sp. T2]|uniref:hypothetical protein n=1 Tax=Chryseolinea sp. T2 TaxID=3129255 RepID=UPI003076C90C
MLENLPISVSAAFALITVLTLVLFRRILSTANSPSTRRLTNIIIGAMLLWLILQGVLSFAGVYSDNLDALPPRIFLFGVLPALILIVATFASSAGRQFIDSLDLYQLTALHTIRILVELVLWWLFIEAAVPKVMTFEGRNLDIIAGLTAPLVALYGVRKNILTKLTVIAWNFICIGLLFNIVIIAVLAVPSPLQKLAFDQPNRAVLYFPFSWLPAFVVPVVLFCHLAAIRQLLRRSN